MKNEITLDYVVEFLNSLLEVDRKAISALCATRVPCNEKLAEHETVQVAALKDDDGNYHSFTVGLIGILNGLFGVNEDGYGYILAVVEDDTNVINKFMTRTEYLEECEKIKNEKGE